MGRCFVLGLDWTWGVPDEEMAKGKPTYWGTAAFKDGNVYLPCVPREKNALAAALRDGIKLAYRFEHFYFPCSWLKKEYPKDVDIITRMESAMREQHAMHIAESMGGPAPYELVSSIKDMLELETTTVN
jgi:hypothetical protein